MPEFAGIDGFLPGSRASLMLDLVFLAMFAVIPIMAWSIYQVRYQGRYLLHKRVQLALGWVLLITVTAFEVDMRINGWRDRAEPSPFASSDEHWGLVDQLLAVHLVFAISTALIWVVVIYRAWRRFPNPPQPCEHSPSHIFWARIAALDMTLTAITGWMFYWVAFVAAH